MLLLVLETQKNHIEIIILS